MDVNKGMESKTEFSFKELVDSALQEQLNVARHGPAYDRLAAFEWHRIVMSLAESLDTDALRPNPQDKEEDQ